MVRGFRKEKRAPEEFNITCPRCGSDNIAVVPGGLDPIPSGGSRLPLEPHRGFFICQQCGFRFIPGEEKVDA